MISVIVLTHNDEKILERCLGSLSWCDEVIVIDDNSTDKTVELAKKLGAKVFKHKLDDDFSEQRNFGLDRAGGEWVLFVDSDEIVSEELKKEIIGKTRNVIPASEPGSREKKDWIPGQARNDDSIIGFYVRRTDWMWGRWLAHGETSSVKLLRLARRGSGEWFRPIHEEWKVTGSIGELSEPLLHYPHPNVAQFLKEIDRYSTLNARYLHEQKIEEPSWYLVGKPLAKFFSNYFWRLGFMDGTPGAVYAIMMSFHSFLTRSKLYLLNHHDRTGI